MLYKADFNNVSKYWKYHFERDSLILGSVNLAFKNIITYASPNKKLILKEFSEMLSVYYPEYLQKFEALLLLK